MVFHANSYFDISFICLFKNSKTTNEMKFNETKAVLIRTRMPFIFVFN